MLGAQGAICGGYVCLSIANNIQRDLTSKMIESHRLMPVPPRLAVLGYIAGCAVSTAPIALVNLVLGGMAATTAGLPVSWWLVANGVMLTFCMFLWCAAAVGGFSGGLSGLGMIAPSIGVVMSGGAAGYLLPGLLMLGAPMIGKTVFGAQAYDGDSVIPLVLATVVQGGMAAVFIAGASRRFRGSDLPAFPGMLGVILIFCFAAGSAMALVIPGVLPQHLGFRSSPTAPGSILGLLVLGLAILSATVADYLVEEHRHHSSSWSIRREILTLGGILGSILILCAFSPQVGAGNLVLRTSLTLLCCAIFLGTVLLWARWMYKAYISLIGLIVLMATQCLIPPVIAAFLRDENGSLTFLGRQICQISVFAAIPAIWDDRLDYFVPTSILFQLGLLVVPVILLYLRHRRPSMLRPV
jgi:hypothetical protein